jgi:hypothetical protein
MTQIEVIGCTSAGKSTLIRQMLVASRGQKIPVATSYDFVLNQFGVGWIQNHKLRMLLLNLFTLLACLVSWHRYRRLIHFATEVVWRLPASMGVISKAKIFRIVCRNIGIDRILRDANSVQQIVLADEGILQIAHYLFVHVDVEPNLDELTEFLQIAPLPDGVLYLQQPISVLLERVNRRGHHRVPAHISTAAEAFIQHAVVIFDHMAHALSLQSRLTGIDGQKFNKSQLIDPNDAPVYDESATKALQTILEIVNSALSDGSNDHNVNVRGSLDHSIGSRQNQIRRCSCS